MSAATPVRRSTPTDDAQGWEFHQPGRQTWEWAIYRDLGGRDVQYIESTAVVDHASGTRSVCAHVPIDVLLDTLAATAVGRKALLDALVRHEASVVDSHIIRLEPL